MQVTTDVLVIGSGIAGLIAAIASASQGAKVTIASAGCGTYSISSGCIDLLGQIGNEYVEDPWEAMFKLETDHPYRLIGQENIKQALDFFLNLVQKTEEHFFISQDANNNPLNTLLPNILGTFKPSYLIPESLDSRGLFAANRVLICGVQGLRDLSSKLVKDNLAKDKRIKAKHFKAIELPSPSESTHRSLSALDLARYVNKEEGFNWLSTCLGRYANAFDAVLLPPICGTSNSHQILADLQKLLGAKVSELLAIPPGVGGLRLHDLLLKAAEPLNLRFLENTKIVASRVENNQCVKVSTAQNRLEITAKAYVLASGGILGGGLSLTTTKAIEPIFQIKQAIDPNNLSNLEIFAPQPIAKLGLSCDQQLHPLINAEGQILENVFLAGKIIAGYDYATEKSGHGVALATGWLSGTLAAKLAGSWA